MGSILKILNFLNFLNRTINTITHDQTVFKTTKLMFGRAWNFHTFLNLNLSVKYIFYNANFEKYLGLSPLLPPKVGFWPKSPLPPLLPIVLTLFLIQIYAGGNIRFPEIFECCMANMTYPGIIRLKTKHIVLMDYSFHPNHNK